MTTTLISEGNTNHKRSYKFTYSWQHQVYVNLYQFSKLPKGTVNDYKQQICDSVDDITSIDSSSKQNEFWSLSEY